MRRLACTLLGALALSFASPVAAGAVAPPAPDAAFGGDGTVTFGAGAALFAVAAGPGGGVLVGGWRRTGETFVPIVVRLTSSGARDATFGSNGETTIPTGIDEDAAVVALEQLADGRIVALVEVADVDGGGSVRDVLVRLRADGSPDTTFAGDGTLVRPPRDDWSRPTLHVEPTSGRIGLARNIAPFSSIHLYGEDGRTNVDIGDNGVLRANFLAGESWQEGQSYRSVGLTGWGLRPDGSTVVAGSVQWSHVRCTRRLCTHQGPPRRDKLFGFDPTGERDAALGGGARIALAPHDESAYLNMGDGPLGQVHVLEDGRAVVVSAGVGAAIEVARFLRDGRRDRSFNQTGRAVVPASEPADRFSTLGAPFHSAIDSRGRLVVAFADRIARISATGRVDASFDPDAAWLPGGAAAIDVAATGRIYHVAERSVGALAGGDDRSVVPRIWWTAPACGWTRRRSCTTNGSLLVRGRVSPAPPRGGRRISLELSDASCGFDSGRTRIVDVVVRADGTFGTRLGSLGRRRWAITARIAPHGAATDARSRPLHVRHPLARCRGIAIPATDPVPASRS